MLNVKKLILLCFLALGACGVYAMEQKNSGNGCGGEEYGNGYTLFTFDNRESQAQDSESQEQEEVSDEGAHEAVGSALNFENNDGDFDGLFGEFLVQNDPTNVNECPLPEEAFSYVPMTLSLVTGVAKEWPLDDPYRVPEMQKLFELLRSEYDDVEELHQNIKRYSSMINERDFCGETPLTSVCSQKSGNMVDVVKLLVEEGANIHKTNAKEMTPLLCALDACNPRVFQFLIAQDTIDVNTSSKNGTTLLMMAIKRTVGPHRMNDSCYEIVEALLLHTKIDVHKESSFGNYSSNWDSYYEGKEGYRTPLCMAVRYDKVRVVKSVLLCSKIHNGEVDICNGFSIACMQGKPDIVKVFLDYCRYQPLAGSLRQGMIIADITARASLWIHKRKFGNAKDRSAIFTQQSLRHFFWRSFYKKTDEQNEKADYDKLDFVEKFNRFVKPYEKYIECIVKIHSLSNFSFYKEVNALLAAGRKKNFPALKDAKECRLFARDLGEYPGSNFAEVFRIQLRSNDVNDATGVTLFKTLLLL